MYCQKCGKKLAPGSKFCNICGSSISNNFIRHANSSYIKDGEGKLLFKLKPIFVGWLNIISIIPFQIFMTLWSGVFFGLFSQIPIKFLNLDIPLWLPFIFFGGIFFFGLPYIFYTVKKKTYSKTIYSFYDDKLEYFEGFFTLEEKSIDYSNIKEVSLRKGFLQRKYGLGTIILSTPATGYSTGVSRSGICINDVKEPDAVYKKVKELVGNSKIARAA